MSISPTLPPKRRIHVFTSDFLPFPGCPRTAGGNRSLQIINALRSAGHDVTFSMPLGNFIGKKNRDRILPQLTEDEIWASENFDEPAVVLNKIQPYMAIYCNVNTFRTVSHFARDIVNVLDFYGPLQLEGLFLDAPEYEPAMHDGQLLERFCREMVEKLREMDYVLTVSERQKYFWSAYCSMAGFSLSDLNVLVCPAAFEAPRVTRNPAPNLTVVYSGGFYPWQNPDRALRNAASILEPIEGATLHIFGGAHAGTPNEAHVGQLISDLEKFRCVRYHGYRPVEEVMATLSTAWCALELMEQNLERELAITGRTLEFLGSGTPVIYNDYATLSKLIEQYRAGWTISSADPSALRSVFDELQTHGLSLVNELSANASRLAASEFSGGKFMEPLLELCARPTTRRKRAYSCTGSGDSSPAVPSGLGRILAISPSYGALRELRVSNPLRALQRQGLIEGVSLAGIFCEELRHDKNFYDAILIQRAVPELVYETLHNLCLPFALDCDDNILARAAYRNDRPETAILPGLRYCSVLTAPNPRLVRKLERYSGMCLTGKAFIVPNGLPFPGNACRSASASPSQILWIQSDIAALGSSRESVIRAVDDFSQRYELPIVLIGPTVLKQPQFKHQTVMGEIDFTANLQLLQFGPSSIGVAPLETDADEETLDFVAGKSDLKMLLFAGYGHAGVYSSAPPYSDSPFESELAVVDNTYEGWVDALEYQYREGWRKVGGVSERMQSERHIDVVARESWLPALRACRLSKPVRGADLYEAFESAKHVDPLPARSIAYMMSNWDVARTYLAYGDRKAWDHYSLYGQREQRIGVHAREAHVEFLERISRETAELVARAKEKSKKEEMLAQALRKELSALRAQRQNSSDEIGGLRAELTRLKEQLSLTHRTLEGMERSRSWKLTAPLRKATGLLKKS